MPVRAPDGNITEKSTWMPTRKWIGGLVTGLAAILAVTIESGGFDGTEKGMLATLITSLVSAYFVTNQPTPGGVPTKSERV